MVGWGDLPIKGEKIFDTYEKNIDTAAHNPGKDEKNSNSYDELLPKGGKYLDKIMQWHNLNPAPGKAKKYTPLNISNLIHHYSLLTKKYTIIETQKPQSTHRRWTHNGREA